MHKILTLIQKEWADAFRNRYVLFIVLLMPLLMVGLPLGILAASSNEDMMQSLNMSDIPPGLLEQPPFDTLTAEQAMQAFVGQQFTPLFLIVPLAIPMTIASYSIVGEKRERSLEPLLAAPISTAQLLAGKAVAAAGPGVLGAWVGALVYVLALPLALPDAEVRAVLVGGPYVVSTLIVAPLLTVLATTAGLTISSRVNDPRVAEQLGMVVIVPVLALIFAQIGGLITFDVTLALFMAGVLVVVDLGLLALAVRVFRRETILTRWR